MDDVSIGVTDDDDDAATGAGVGADDDVTDTKVDAPTPDDVDDMDDDDDDDIDEPLPPPAVTCAVICGLLTLVVIDDLDGAPLVVVVANDVILLCDNDCDIGGKKMDDNDGALLLATDGDEYEREYVSPAENHRG